MAFVVNTRNFPARNHELFLSDAKKPVMKCRRKSRHEAVQSQRGGEEADSIEDALQQAKELMNAVQAQAKSNPDSKKPHFNSTPAFTPAPRGPITSPSTPNYVAIEPRTRVKLSCDVNGCTVIHVDEAEPAESSAIDGGPLHVILSRDGCSMSGTLLGSFREEAEDGAMSLLEGKGWKIGIDQRMASLPKSSSQYCAFVGGDNWSVSLTAEEYHDFIHLLKNLRYVYWNRGCGRAWGAGRQGVATLEVCGDWGGEGSEAQLEMKTPRIWMQGRAPQRRLKLLRRLWSRKSLDSDELPLVAFSLRFMLRSANSREAEGTWNANAVMQILKALDEAPVKSNTTESAVL